MNVRRWKTVQASVACVMDSALTWTDRTFAVVRPATGWPRTGAHAKV